MADIADEATEHTERTLAEALARHRGTIPEGVQGECDLCGAWSERLVKGRVWLACAPCRDQYGLE